MSYEIHHIDQNDQKRSFSFSLEDFMSICEAIKNEIAGIDQELSEDCDTFLIMGYFWIDKFDNKRLLAILSALKKLRISYLEENLQTPKKTLPFDFEKHKKAAILGIESLMESLQDELG